MKKTRPLPRFVIMTRPASPEVAFIHDRMPGNFCHKKRIGPGFLGADGKRGYFSPFDRESGVPGCINKNKHILKMIESIMKGGLRDE